MFKDITLKFKQVCHESFNVDYLFTAVFVSHEEVRDVMPRTSFDTFCIDISFDEEETRVNLDVGDVFVGKEESIELVFRFRVKRVTICFNLDIMVFSSFSYVIASLCFLS